MKIYVIRHGETDLNVKHYRQGWTDEPLNEEGRKLARLSGQGLRGVRFDACVTSPLIRARETVEIVLRESGNGSVPVRTDDRLKEINFGEEENTHVSASLLDPETAQLFLTDALRFPGCPGGESIRDVCRRTWEFLTELAALDDGRTWLVGTHGCALRAMMNPLYQDPNRFWQGSVPPNCSFTILGVRDGKPYILESDKVFYDPALVVDHYRDLSRN